MKRKLNPEWVKLGPKADVHFIFSPYVNIGPVPKINDSVVVKGGKITMFKRNPKK